MLGRRALLTMVGLPLLAACSRAAGPPGASLSSRSRAAPTSSSSTATALELPVEAGPAAVPGLLQAFNAAQTAVRATAPLPKAQTTAVARLVDVPEYGVVQMSGLGGLEPLDAALRAANFDPASLETGSVAALTVGGRTVALPVTQQPWAVQWRADVFAAAGLAAPAADWNLDDFETTCVALATYAKSGKQPAIGGALAPFLGSYTMPQGPTDAYTTTGAPGLWVGFVQGFGGSAVSGGDFRLTGDRTLAGLQRMLDLSNRFAGPPASGAPGIRDFAAVASGCTASTAAMAFAPYRPVLVAPGAAGSGLAKAGTYDCSPWRWARLPRFPVDPVIPTAVLGAGLAPPKGATATFDAQADVAAAVSFLLWTYGPQAQAALFAAGVVPVAGTGTVQGPFWAGLPADARAAGDWQHFRPYSADWPTIPQTDHVALALEQAARTGTDLATLLSAAEQAMNGAATSIASSAGPATA